MGLSERGVSLVGWVRISDGTESIDVRSGDSALIREEETVSLINPGEETAHVLVAAGPAYFVARIRQWPQPVAL